jgi:hypothetical protein
MALLKQKHIKGEVQLTVSSTITNRLIIANKIGWCGRKQKYVHSKMVAKLKNKIKSMTTVPDQYLTFASFLTPLCSRWSLPLSSCRI